jgi:hypothetical protein
MRRHGLGCLDRLARPFDTPVNRLSSSAFVCGRCVVVEKEGSLGRWRRVPRPARILPASSGEWCLRARAITLN